MDSIGFYNRIKIFKKFSVLLLTRITQSYIMQVRKVRNAFLIRGVNQERLFPALAGAVYIFQKEAMNLKDRKRQRENRRIKQREERIDKRNGCGVKDLTAYNAVRQIMTNGKANIMLT